MRITVLASSLRFSSITLIVCRRDTSGGTKWRSSASIEYSTTRLPAKVLRVTSGTCIWITSMFMLSTKASE